MAQIEEPMFVQAFVAEAAVERLDVGVLIRLAWLDQPQLHVVAVRPFQHRTPGELLPVIGSDDVRIAAALADAIENADQVIATQCVLRMSSNAFCG